MKIAALEGAEAGTVTASGMAAIASALMVAVDEGEHLLLQEQLYGGTFHFVVKHLAKMGRSYSFISLDDPASWASQLRPTSRAIYVESLSNPMLRAPDLGAVTRFAREHSLVSMIDNTFPSPINLNPIAHGFDLVLHSATKYLNGHTDLTAGAVVGSKDLVRRIIALQNHLGGTLDPHACYLLQRGLKTLGVRVRQQNASALKVAQFLEQHRRVRQVIYPGLSSHPQHTMLREVLRGFGGMLSFEFDGPVDVLDKKLQSMSLAYCAPSLGGTETLVTRPRTTSHSGIPASEALKMGITDTLVRVSIGLEDSDDLIQDFKEALD
jgi:cystathionine beta-lyase/cystathionine gamma-synthase